MNSEVSWIAPLAVIKGLIMAAVIVGVAETSFLQSLVVAVCSASVSGLFLLFATHLQAKRTQRQLDETKDQLSTKVDEATHAVQTAVTETTTGGEKQ